VATLGPASSDPEILKKLILNGMNVARLNMAHGSHTEHAKRIALFRNASNQLNAGAGILMDLPGPKIRVSHLSAPSLDLKRNDDVYLTTNPRPGQRNTITISYKNLLRDVRKNEAVYLCDGLIRIRAEAVQSDKIRCVVTHGGTVHVGNGVNLPHSTLSMEAFTPLDREHLAFGIRHGIDFVGVSFVGSAQDLDRVRSFCKRQGRTPFIIAKIERQQALKNLRSIIEAADGVMVARGDLGIEEQFSKVPVIQSEIVALSRSLGKPVIVATQVLESMIQNPRPTRAEATDVANAIAQGADAIMLSGESAIGKYPVEAVSALSEIIRETERVSGSTLPIAAPVASQPKKVIAREACRIAEKIGAQLILVQSETGKSARRIARFRPRVPVLALVDDERVRRGVSLLWGVQAHLRSIRVSMYRNTALFSWLRRTYKLQGPTRVVFIDTPVGTTGKIVLSVIEQSR
jgi:pyruvate kinase